MTPPATAASSTPPRPATGPRPPREQDRLADLFEIVYTPNGRVSGGAAGLGAFKTALQLMGVIESNTMSAPMLSLNEDETTAIKVILERNGLDLGLPATTQLHR